MIFLLYPTFYNVLLSFELITKIRLSNNSFEFLNLITIEYWLWYVMLQKGLTTNIAFNNQLYVSVVKFRKCFTNFMISITLFSLNILYFNFMIYIHKIVYSNTLQKD